ncbi:hypothetical protein EJB05_29967, partial [Eragrostis curvula]
MDCCVCSPMASKYRLPRNAICAPCHEGAKAIIAFLDNDEHQDGEGHGSVMSPRSIEANSSPKASVPDNNSGLRDAWEKLKEMRDREEATNQRAAYLEHGFALAWKEGIHTDIIVKPGSGPPIPAHKAILAARSEVLRHVLSGDDEGCKAPAGDSISLPELSHEELSLFQAFLYTGALDDQQQEEEDEHLLHALLVAGDKYDVPFLRRACEARLAARVDARNALRSLEVAELSGSAALKDRAMATVVEHAEQLVFPSEYHDFALRNASLCVQITRALLDHKNNSARTNQ